LDLAPYPEDERSLRMLFACKYLENVIPVNPHPHDLKFKSFVIERGIWWEEALKRSHLPIDLREAHEGLFR
jgi:hypothetical protein